MALSIALSCIFAHAVTVSAVKLYGSFNEAAWGDDNVKSSSHLFSEVLRSLLDKPEKTSSQVTNPEIANEEMMNAVVQENKGSESALAAAKKMTDAMKARAKDVLAKAEEKVKRISKTSNEHLETLRVQAEKISADQENYQKNAVEKLKSDSAALASKLVATTKPEEMIKLVAAADDKAKSADVTMGEIKKKSQESQDALIQSTKDCKDAGEKAVNEIDVIKTNEVDDIKAMATQLKDLGAKAAAKLAAKDAANQITVTTSSSADEIKGMAMKSDVVVSSAADEVRRESGSLATHFGELQAAMKASAEGVMTQLTFSSKHAQEQIASARLAWMKASMSAVQDINDKDASPATSGGSDQSESKIAAKALWPYAIYIALAITGLFLTALVMLRSSGSKA